MTRSADDLLARLDDTGLRVNMRDMAADFMLLPRVEQDRALAHPQAARYFLTSAVHTLREDCVFHFNRHLPEEWDDTELN